MLLLAVVAAKRGRSTLDPKKGYKTKTGSTSWVTLTLTRPLDHVSSVATATGRSRVPSSAAAEAAQQAPTSQQGSLASHGTGKRDKQAVRVKNALGEVEHEIRSSYEATVWGKLEDGTTKAYSGALYKFLC